MIGWVRAALLLSVLLFLPGLREDFETPKTAAVRVCGLAALASVLACGVALRRVRWTPLDLAVLGWLAADGVATGFSSAPWLSLLGEPVQREGLATSLAVGGLYFATRLGAGDRAGLERTLGIVVVAAGAASAYGLLQAAGHDPLQWSPAQVGGFPTAVGRPFGTLGHPNLLGVVAAAAAAAALAAVAAGRGSGWWAGAGAVCVAATLVTLSRAAWLGLAVGSAAGIACLLAMRAIRISRRGWWVAAGIALAVVAVLGASGWGERLAGRFAELSNPTQGSGAARLQIWRSALAAWGARPWVGWGPDTFAMVFPRYQTPEFWRHEWAALPLHAHSIPLHTLATRGLLGAVAGAAWMVGLGLAARAAWRRSPGAAPAVAMAIAGLAAIAVAGGFGAVGISGHVLFAALSGGVAALASPDPDAAPRPAGSRAGLAVAACAALWAAADLAASRQVAVAESWLASADRSPPAAAVESRARSLRAVRAARALAPADDFATRLEADVLLADAEAMAEPRGRLLEATEVARRGLALVPERAENHAQLARALAYRVASGDGAALAEAQAEIQRTARLAPASAMILCECARLELLLERPDLAHRLAGRSVWLYPDDGPSLLMLARVRLASGDRDGALEALARAASGEWHGDAGGRAGAQAALEAVAAQGARP